MEGCGDTAPGDLKVGFCFKGGTSLHVVDLSKASLHGNGMVHGVDGAWELDQQAIADRLKQASAEFLDVGFEYILAKLLKAGNCPGFILAHEP